MQLVSRIVLVPGELLPLGRHAASGSDKRPALPRRGNSRSCTRSPWPRLWHLVAAVREQLANRWRAFQQLLDDFRRSIPILRFGRLDPQHQRRSIGVNSCMSLPTVDSWQPDAGIYRIALNTPPRSVLHGRPMRPCFGISGSINAHSSSVTSSCRPSSLRSYLRSAALVQAMLTFILLFLLWRIPRIQAALDFRNKLSVIKSAPRNRNLR